MRRQVIMLIGAAALSVAMLTSPIAGQSQQQQQPPPTPPPATPGRGAKPAPPPDPRVGLAPGVTDAGVAAMGLELVGHADKPEAFNDPSGRGGLGFANSDLAFKGTIVFHGNFYGLNFFDAEDPRKPQLRTSFPCPGGQGDVSVHGNLLFMSVEEGRGRIDCGTQGNTEQVSKERFRGVRIFDIKDLAHPKQIAAVQTCRGSHTHTLVVNPKDKQRIYIYGSGTSGVRSAEELEICSGGQPDQNPETALYSIDVIEVPLAAPQKARIVNRPRIFADPQTGAIAGLWAGGDHGRGTQRTSTTNQCHDITTYPELGLAAGACSGNGILLDISDPVNPVRLDYVGDPNFAYWHSATFNNDGTKVIFTDEWGGGTSPRCRESDLPTWGANAIFTIEDRRRLRFGGYFKIPAAQTEQENCVAHNGSLIPVPGRDIMVQGWYQGGVSVFDFTDAARPVEIAYFDRGPYSAERLVIAGHWSAYWYNGHIYASEIARGLDIFRLVPTEQLSQNEIDAAMLVKFGEFNAQHQPRMTWPNSPIVARAYVDQLNRSKGITPERASAVSAALDGSADQRRTLAAELDADAAKAKPRDAATLRALAGVLRALR